MAKELKTAAWGSLCSCRAIIDSCWQIIAHRCRCWRIIKDGYCCLYTHCLLTLLASSLWRLNFFYWNALQILFEPDAHNDLLNLFKNHQDASDLHFSLRLWMFFRCHHFTLFQTFIFCPKSQFYYLFRISANFQLFVYILVRFVHISNHFGIYGLKIYLCHSVHFMIAKLPSTWLS